MPVPGEDRKIPDFNVEVEAERNNEIVVAFDEISTVAPVQVKTILVGPSDFHKPGGNSTKVAISNVADS